MALVPGDRSLSVKAVAGTFGVLACVSVSLRCYVRLKIVKSFGWDDGFMVVALVSILSGFLLGPMHLSNEWALPGLLYSTECLYGYSRVLWDRPT
jgi:hypothetical protein